MDIFLYLTSPVTSTIAILGVLFVMGAAIHIFLTKTATGNAIMNKTTWMGWSEKTEEDPYSGFRIHSSNYMHVSR